MFCQSTRICHSSGEIYQAIDAKAALGYLELYTESKESVGLKNIEKYPVSLRKEYKRLSVISGAFERACS